MTEPLAVLAVLCASVALADWLGRKPGWHLLGAALLVIALAALCANLGVIPSVTDGSPIYDGVFAYIAPLAIFWLLLGVDLRSVLAAGLPMLGMFGLGALGTLLGVLAAMHLLDGNTFGEFRAALGGMFVGTYVGGALNFNAVALEYGVQREGLVYASAGVVDNLMTTVWMIVTIAMPRAVAPFWPTRSGTDARRTGGAPSATLRARDEREGDDEHVSPGDIATLITLGAMALVLAERITTWLAAKGVAIPEILILTTLALALAQIPWVQRRRGAQVLGMFAVLLFLAAIGALCDVAELRGRGALGTALVWLVVITVAVHGAIVLVGAWWLRIDPAVAAVASQANIGGGTSALALARGLDRPDLVAPALLIGALGNAAGTYLGLLAASLLA
ncbi:MAG: DUF819 family protein [Pseudomonadota bacterium]